MIVLDYRAYDLQIATCVSLELRYFVVAQYLVEHYEKHTIGMITTAHRSHDEAEAVRYRPATTA